MGIANRQHHSCQNAGATVTRTVSTVAAEWAAAQEAVALALAASNEARSAAAVLHPPLPEVIKDPRYHETALSNHELGRRGLAKIAANWEDACAAVDARFGVSILDAAYEAATWRAHGLGEEMASLRPTSTAELALKFAVLLEHFGDGEGGIDSPSPIRAFLADLERVAALNGRSEPKITAAPPRELLESYNSWLFMERRLLSRELYPELGAKAELFVPCGNAGDRWHFEGPVNWKQKPQPSSRAELILRTAGVL